MKLFVILCLISHLLLSETFTFQEGKTYDFAEKNALTDIQEHIKKNDKNIEAKIAKKQLEQKSKAREWKPELRKLTAAKKHKVFYPDMTYTVPEDIKDARGQIMYAKGFKFNPADYVHMQQEIVIIDASNKVELEWAKKNNYLDSSKYMVLLADGNAFEITEEFKKPAYYLTKEVADKFQIQKTPSLIKQIENKIKVSEICLKNCQ